MFIGHGIGIPLQPLVGGGAGAPILTLEADWIRDFGTLDHAIGGGPISFSRNDLGTFFDENGVLQTASNNVARFSHSALFTGVKLGLVFEPATTNRVLHNRDLANAAWTKTNALATRVEDGLDGVANSATRLRSTAANGSASQTVTLASLERTFEVWLKRETGSGTVTIGDGTNTQEVSGSLSTTQFRRFNVISTQANPTVSITLGTSGDGVVVDFAMLTDGAGFFLPIETTTAAVTKQEDSFTFTDNFFNEDEGTWFFEFIDTSDANPAGTSPIVASSSPNQVFIGASTATNGVVKLSVAAETATANSYGGDNEIPERIASSWNNSTPRKAVVLNGGAVASSADAGVSAPAEFRYMRNNIGLEGFRGTVYMQKSRFWNGQLSDAQIQALTAQ